jgi:ATP-dependent RNA helicase DDX54/DBP10
LVKTESGTKLPATYRSGRYDEWKTKTRLSLPKVGEMEDESVRLRQSRGNKFRHNRVIPAKPLDKLRGDYDRKARQMKKQKSGENDGVSGSSRAKNAGKRSNGKPIGKVKTELKTVEQIRKNRKLMQKRKAKNARPSRRKGRR